MSDLINTLLWVVPALILSWVLVWWFADMRKTFKHDITLLTEMLETLKRIEARESKDESNR